MSPATMMISLQMLANMDYERRKKCDGSVPGRDVLHRGMSSGYLHTVADYFADSPIYNAKFFR